MSEKDPTLLTCGMCGEKSLRIHNFVDCIAALKRDIAAAEERGRRAGIGEREALLRECESLIASCGGMADRLGYAGTAQKCRDMLVKLSALAPRDSGPKHKDWCALFGNPEAGKSCDCGGDRK